MSSSTSGAEDAADDDVVFSDAKEEVEVDQIEVGVSLTLHSVTSVTPVIRAVFVAGWHQRRS